MEDNKKTRNQLLQEIIDLRRQLAKLSPPNLAKCENTSQNDYAFLDTIADGYYEMDLNGVFTYVNQALCDTHGYRPEELLGHAYRQFIPSIYVSNLQHLFDQVSQCGRSRRLPDFEFVQQDGGSRNVDGSAALICNAQGEAIGFRGILRDATEKKAKERELERYRIFVEAMQEGVFEIDLKGHITFLNPAACRIFGYPPEKLMGMNSVQYTSPEAAEMIHQTFDTICTTGQPQEIAGYEIERSDGQTRYLDLTASVITDESGTPIGYRGIYKDVTHRKIKEAENQRLMAKVNHSKRMEALGTLAAGVAHNFNNLLMSIQGFISIIFLDLPKDHPHYASMQTIEDLIKRGADLTTKLLGYARHGNYATEPTDLRKTVRIEIKNFQKSYKNVTLDEQVPETIWQVAADYTQMKQVFKDLFANAGEAMPNGGSLFVEMENTILKERFTEPYNRNPGPYVKISIRDTGVGMDQATCERVFEPFFSTKHFSKGAGLGLPAAYGIVNNHGGIILLESKKDQGTNITVYWPALPKASPGITDDTAGVQHTVLVVDDDIVIRKLLEKALTKLNYKVLTATDGHEAEQIIQADPEQIDVAIIDIILPDVSGTEVVEAVRDLAPHTKFILISGFPESRIVKDSMRDTRQAFLQKPIQPSILSQTIRQLLDT